MSTTAPKTTLTSAAIMNVVDVVRIRTTNITHEPMQTQDRVLVAYFFFLSKILNGKEMKWKKRELIKWHQNDFYERILLSLSK